MCEFFLLKESNSNEVKFMIKCLETDTINDTSVCVPSSIVVYQKDAVGREICEFDGIIIHPMRKTKQIVFLEVKNTLRSPSYGKNA